MGEPGVEWLADQLKDISAADFLIELRRIADALETQVRPTACGEQHASGKPCILDERHVGHHATSDGRLHWLDE
jgi:hypothetical protein